VRREFLQPHIVIVQQPVLGVVDVNAGGDVHCIGTGILVTTGFGSNRPRSAASPELDGGSYQSGSRRLGSEIRLCFRVEAE
jgi:hypothetical protein